MEFRYDKTHRGGRLYGILQALEEEEENSQYKRVAIPQG